MSEIVTRPSDREPVAFPRDREGLLVPLEEILIGSSLRHPTMPGRTISASQIFDHRLGGRPFFLSFPQGTPNERLQLRRKRLYIDGAFPVFNPRDVDALSRSDIDCRLIFPVADVGMRTAPSVYEIQLLRSILDGKDAEGQSQRRMVDVPYTEDLGACLPDGLRVADMFSNNFSITPTVSPGKSFLLQLK